MTKDNTKKCYFWINKELLKKIRLNTNIWDLTILNTESFEIVPENLNHRYLENNFDIDNSILNFYYLNTKKMITDNEYEEFKENGYIAKKHRLLEPYSIIINGAYLSRKDIYIKLSRDILNKNYVFLCNGNKVECLEDLKPYFSDYSKGFKNGFNQFENNCIKPYLNDYSDKNDFATKVFEYVTKENFYSLQNWENTSFGFSYDLTDKENEFVINKGFENGEIQGYFYKAWSLIFSNNSLFEPLFKNIPILKQVPEDAKHIFTDLGYTIFEIASKHYLEINKNLMPNFSSLWYYLESKAFKKTEKKLVVCIQKDFLNYVQNLSEDASNKITKIDSRSIKDETRINQLNNMISNYIKYHF